MATAYRSLAVSDFQLSSGSSFLKASSIGSGDERHISPFRANCLQTMSIGRRCPAESRPLSVAVGTGPSCPLPFLCTHPLKTQLSDIAASTSEANFLDK